MPRIKKDYKNRHRTPINVHNSQAVDDAKMSGKAAGSGGQQSNNEHIITHTKAYQDRAHRNQVPNASLNKKR